MKFFDDDNDIPESVAKKIDSAPLTNSGAESNFSQLDLECRRGSGQTKLKTMSDRHMVKGNRYFESDLWKDMTPELKAKEWDFARKSSKAKIVKEMRNEFIEKVKAAEKLSGAEKIKKKLKKNVRTLKLLESIKIHGGSVTSSDVDKPENLTESQIPYEVRYLRKTVPPNI